jgi:hypothetical protein
MTGLSRTQAPAATSPTLTPIPNPKCRVKRGARQHYGQVALRGEVWHGRCGATLWAQRGVLERSMQGGAASDAGLSTQNGAALWARGLISNTSVLAH